MPEKKSGNDPAIQTRAKAIFALSTILIQNAAAVMRLDEVHGWEILKKALAGKKLFPKFSDNTLTPPVHILAYNNR